MRTLLLGLVATCGLAAAQNAPAGAVIGVGNFIHVISDVPKSLEFYHDVLGLDLQGPPGTQINQPRPYINTPEIVNLYNAVGAQYRVGNAFVPESPMRAELVEWNQIDRKPVQPRYQDPGAATMVLGVHDLDAIMARVKKSGAPVVTTGGEPIMLPDGRAILLKDPDGFFVELVERQAPAGASNLIDVGFAFTVSETDRMVHVFKDALGFEFTKGAFQADKTRLKLMGMNKAQYKETTSIVPGTAFHVSLLEFKGIDRMPVHSRPQDPGSPVLRLRIKDMDATVKALEAVGVHVASHEAEPVTLKGAANTQRFAITGAPDNLFVQVVQQVATP